MVLTSKRYAAARNKLNRNSVLLDAAGVAKVEDLVNAYATAARAADDAGRLAELAADKASAARATGDKARSTRGMDRDDPVSAAANAANALAKATAAAEDAQSTLDDIGESIDKVLLRAVYLRFQRRFVVASALMLASATVAAVAVAVFAWAANAPAAATSKLPAVVVEPVDVVLRFTDAGKQGWRTKLGDRCGRRRTRCSADIRLTVDRPLRTRADGSV